MKARHSPQEHSGQLFAFAGAIALVFFTASCSRLKNDRVSMNVAVNNSTTNTYWVAGNIEIGICSPGGDKTLMDMPAPETNMIHLDLLKYPLTTPPQKETIQLDVSALQHLSPGRHKVTISIKSDHEAKLLIDGQEK